MPVEVLEEKKLPSWSIEIVCQGQRTARSKPGCGSRLRATAECLTRVRDHVKHNGVQVAVVVCPLAHCGVETDIETESVPAWVFDSLVEGPQRGRPTYHSGKD